MHSATTPVVRAATPFPAVVHIINTPDDDVPIPFFITERLIPRRA
jgi:hypothetical protein